MLTNRSAIFSLAMLAVLSFMLSFLMSGVDPSQISTVLFAIIGVSYTVGIGIYKTELNIAGN